MLHNVEREKAAVGQKIVICGGGSCGVQCAVGLAKQGKNVPVIDQILETDFCKDRFFITRIVLFDEGKENGVRLFGDHKVV